MKGLVKHLALSGGEIIDCTARSTVEVLGVPPRVREYGDCNVFVFDLLAAPVWEVPMYTMARLCGYDAPATVGVGSWSMMHPTSIQWKSPAGRGRRWAYYCGYSSHGKEIVTKESYQDWLLSRYMGGSLLSGSIPQDFASPKTQKAARQWSINLISPRRGLCTLASTTLLVCTGDTSLLEEAGLSSDGKIEISSLLGLKEALSRLSPSAILSRAPGDVVAASTLDLNLLPKALRYDGLLVNFRKCDSLADAMLFSSLMVNWYRENSLLTSPPNGMEGEMSAWEFRRQIELYLKTYSWETERGMGHPRATAPMMGRNSKVPRHILENIDTTGIEQESPVDILQRTLKERKRNLGITFRTSGPKKSLERMFISERKKDVPTVSGIRDDYLLWRASIDSLFGGVLSSHATVKGFPEYQAQQELPEPPDLSEDSNINLGEIRGLVPVINYLERAELQLQAYPLYGSLMIAASRSTTEMLLGELRGAPTANKLSMKSLGSIDSSAMTDQRSPYSFAFGAYVNCEHLLHPWAGNRMEEIATEFGFEHPPGAAALLDKARAGNLLSKDQPLYEYYRLLATESKLY